MNSGSTSGRRLLRGVWPLAAALAWVGAMVWVGGQIGLAGVGVGLAMSAIPTVVVVAVFLWLGRWVPHRPALLVSAFVWGGSIAAFCAIWSQQGLQSLVDATMGTDVGAWTRPLIITPITEEVLKGLFLVWVLVYRRRRITGVVDAVVLAGLVGAGFAFTENSLYLGRAVMDVVGATAADRAGTVGTLAVLLLLRVGLVPFFHPLMVVLTGIGVGIAANARRRAGRTMPVVAGLLAAVVIHGAWDWAGLASADPYLIFKVYLVVLVPVFIAVGVVVLVLRHRTGRLIASAAPALARDGDITAEDADRLPGLGARRRWRAAARRTAGRPAARAVKRYQAEASALAVRLARGQAERRDVDAQRAAVAAARAATESGSAR